MDFFCQRDFFYFHYFCTQYYFLIELLKDYTIDILIEISTNLLFTSLKLDKKKFCINFMKKITKYL